MGDAAQRYLDSFDAGSCLLLNHDSDRKTYSTQHAPFRPMMGHTGEVYGVGLTPDGKTAISGGEDEVLRVWDVESGECIIQLHGHSARVHSVAISTDGKIAVSGSFDETVRVWNVDNGQCLHILENHTESVDAVALSTDGHIAVSGSRDRTVRIWDASTGRQMHICLGHQENVLSLAISADGKIAVSKGGDRTYRIWDTGTGKCLEKLPVNSDGQSTPALSPDGCRLVFAVAGEIKVWDLEKRRYIKTFKGHSKTMYYFSISADGRWGTSTGEEKTVRLWDLENGTCLRVLKGLNVYPHALSMSADGGIAVSCGNDGALMIWDMLNGISDEGKNNLNSRHAYIPSVDGNIFISGKYGSAFKVWTSEFEEMWKINTVETVNALAISANGRRAVSGHRSGVLKLWDTHTGQCIGNLKGHRAGIASAALSGDGRFAISAGWDHTVRFWDTASKLCLVQIPIEAVAIDIPALALSADGTLALTGGKDKLVKVWDTASGKLLRQFKGHTGIITFIALSLDDKLAFSASRDHTLRVWDMGTGKCIGIKGHPYSINQVSLVNEDVRTVDTSYEVTYHILRNYSLPGSGQIEQILRSLPDGKMPSPLKAQVINSQSMSKIPKDKESCPTDRYCNTCGYRVTVDTAKNRGLTDMGNIDCPMMVWCYYSSEPVDPNHHRKCPHWISYKELDYDLNPPE